MDAESLVYTLDEALNSVGFGKFQALVLLYAGLGYLAESMEVMILSFIGPAIKSEWGLSPSKESLLSTVVFAGMLVGYFSWGFLSDNYGRRKGFLGISLVASVMGLLSAISPNYLSLVTFRGLVGFGLGGGTVFISWFLEFVPASNRGMWIVVLTLFWTLGAILEASLAWIVMPRLNWRWLLAFSSLPSFAVLLFYCLAPESPRYLCMAGRSADAYHILEKMALMNKTNLPSGMFFSDNITRLDKGVVVQEHAPLLSSTVEKTIEVKSGFSSVFMLLSSRFIRATLLIWVLFFGNAFLYYAIVLLTSELSSGETICGTTFLGLENTQSARLYIDVFITSFAELPGLLVAAAIVDRVGRKVSMTIMTVFAFIFILPLVIRQPGTLTIGLLFGARMFANGFNAVVGVYCREVYPTSLRATASGIANSVGRIGAMICPLVAVGLVTGCHQTTAIALVEVVVVLLVVCVLLLPFETKQQDLVDK